MSWAASKKFNPSFRLAGLAPRSKGDLLKLTGQAYAKTPGSRTNAHQENNSVGSIRDRENICKTGYFKNMEDCIADGIPVQMCEQKAAPPRTTGYNLLEHILECVQTNVLPGGCCNDPPRCKMTDCLWIHYKTLKWIRKCCKQIVDSLHTRT
ncbi:unnamed protein product [Caenorhabditis brenneri]